MIITFTLVFALGAIVGGYVTALYMAANIETPEEQMERAKDEFLREEQ